MIRIINGKRYDSRKAEVVASDSYWDGHNWERDGRNTFLMRTPKGNYFTLHQSRWQGERDWLEPLSMDKAIALYESLPEHEMEYEDAFPGMPIEEA